MLRYLRAGQSSEAGIQACPGPILFLRTVFWPDPSTQLDRTHHPPHAHRNTHTQCLQTQKYTHTHTIQTVPHSLIITVSDVMKVKRQLRTMEVARLGLLTNSNPTHRVRFAKYRRPSHAHVGT